ncbi:hypothetical protein Ocin01_03653 [Orchesella cincta]|uniref:F-box domain-containing protein n=1 Tax=Orchesella cincta TaxID=48709 RepID=A0A1D2NCR2_ORCCI|nr:hypothetical protein Ocin01_03653 [Orchesella cincta]
MSDGQNYFGTGTNPYLPPEIWEKIFSNLQASDLLSVCDTCPEWNELLASEKISALIELALPLLNLNLHDTLTVGKSAKV